MTHLDDPLLNDGKPRTRTLLKWLTPGIGVKRWFGILFFGVTALGLAFGMVLLQIFRMYPSPPVEFVVTLGGASLWLRAALAGLAGAGLVAIAIYRINRAILTPLELEQGELIETMMEYRQRQRGPKVVAIGGGTGLPTLLRGLKTYTPHLTAIVTVADDGGSSGRLRRDLGVLPPGDFRNNIAALSRDEGLMTQLFQYRFGEGGLEGHSFGNLLITALVGVTGSFEQAIIESSRVLNIRGQVLPSTLTDVTLMADFREEQTNNTRRIAGESAIPEVAGTIERVFLQPDSIPAYPEAVRAILSADLVVIGPGSLFTSILPNLLVPGIAQALRTSRALKVYVCNVATQRGETDSFTVADHVQVIQQHVGEGLFDAVMANDSFPVLDADANFSYVQIGSHNGHSGLGAKLVSAPLLDNHHPWRHDSNRLAQKIMALLDETTTSITP